jgi:hypothetical protein
VPYLQDLGVRYVMLRSTEAQVQADARPELTMIAESYPWKIYEVAGSDIVVPLTTQPVVVNGRPGDQRERNLELGTSWFQNKSEWAAVPADDGPADWQRIDVTVDESRREVDADGEQIRVDVVVPAQPIEPVALDPVVVSNVDIDDQSLSFDVDRTGVPVLVKVSYFPNWKADGADGPYRVAPNMMVVIPTESTVALSYGRTLTDYATFGLTLLGIALCILWRIRGDLEFDDDTPGRLLRSRRGAPSPGGADLAGTHDDPWHSGRDPFAGTALADVVDEPPSIDPWSVTVPRRTDGARATPVADPGTGPARSG